MLEKLAHKRSINISRAQAQLGGLMNSRFDVPPPPQSAGIPERVENIKVFRNACKTSLYEANYIVREECTRLSKRYLEPNELGDLIWDYHQHLNSQKEKSNV